MNEKILIVDDEQDILQMLGKLLVDENYQVKTALGGEEAISVFKSDPEPFDAVITDMRMPGLDGIGVIKALKEIDEFIEVIILTGHGSEEDKAKCMELGAFGYLQKPVDIEKLSQMIKLAHEKIQNRT